MIGAQIVDEALLPGRYGFELQRPLATVEAFVEELRAEAGLMLTRERRETPTLIVRPRSGA
jgi:hypothetical protein